MQNSSLIQQPKGLNLSPFKILKERDLNVNSSTESLPNQTNPYMQFKNPHPLNLSTNTNNHYKQNQIKQSIDQEEYSFKLQPSYKDVSFESSQQQQSSYSQQNSSFKQTPNEDSSTLHNNEQLLQKYSSVCAQLQKINSNQVIYLLLEQIEENQKNREIMMQQQHQIDGLCLQVKELEELLNKKRQAVRVLCEMETNNLNLIQSLQLRVGKNRNGCFEGHFQKKYRQLTKYMDLYINSNNEAHEEFRKNHSLLKYENTTLTTALHNLHQKSFHIQKSHQILSSTSQKTQKSLSILHQKQQTYKLTIQNVQQQNNYLKKQIQALNKRIQVSKDKEVEVWRENDELTKQLDTIREKMYQNQDFGKDIIEKIEINNHQYELIKQQNENLALAEKQLKHQNSLLTNQLQTLQSTTIRQFQSLTQTHQQSLHILEIQNKKQSAQIQALNQYQQQMLIEYENERQSKHQIKLQLMELAEQVKFMENTYKKQRNKHDLIKEELHRFWQLQEDKEKGSSRNTERERRNSQGRGGKGDGWIMIQNQAQMNHKEHNMSENLSQVKFHQSDS